MPADALTRWRRKARMLAERALSPRGPRGVILLYHRVAEAAADPWGIAVRPESFAQHMKVLRRFGVPCKMDDFARALDDRPASRDIRLAVTFDDGYADTLTNALPALAAEDVPATVYVTSGAIDDPAGFWWDRLSEIFLAQATLPETPCPVPPASVSTEAARRLGPEARLEADARARNLVWSADDEPPRTRRQKLFLAAWSHIVTRAPQDRLAATRALCDWAGVSPAAAEADARPLTGAQLARLASSPLIEIGGHTATHPDLSHIPEDEAADEIRRDRGRLIAMTGQEVSSFAYPFGRMRAETPRLIREAGFTNATCSQMGVATRKSDRFALPRLQVRECSAADLERSLAHLLGRRPRPAPPTGRPASAGAAGQAALFRSS